MTCDETSKFVFKKAKGSLCPSFSQSNGDGSGIGSISGAVVGRVYAGANEDGVK